MSKIKIDRTMHCKCGNETYKIRFGFDEDGIDVATRLECAECGRKTNVLDLGDEAVRSSRR